MQETDTNEHYLAAVLQVFSDSTDLARSAANLSSDDAMQNLLSFCH